MPLLRLAATLAASAVLTARGDVTAPPAPSTKAEPKPLIDSLNQAQMQEIFRVLQQRYIKPDSLNDDELNRAALQGLLLRLELGAALVEKKTEASSASPVPALVAEDLSEATAYLRPGMLTMEELPKVDVTLDKFAAGKAQTLLLDLRSPAPEGDFIAAAQLLSRFLPEGQPLFHMRKAGEEKPRPFVSKGKPRWTRSVIVLVDPECNNVAEVVAAVLKAKAKSFVIGTKTLGRAVQYQEVPVGADKVLRFADAEVLLDGGASLFRQGVTPDFTAPLELDLKRQVFAASEKSGMKPHVYDQERPRMNEAALVAQSNPELDYQIARSAKQPTAWDQPPPKDRVVQQALDFLTATQFLNPPAKPAPKK